MTVVQDGRFPPYAFPLTLGVEGVDGTMRLVTVRIPSVRETTQTPTEIGPYCPSCLPNELDPE